MFYIWLMVIFHRFIFHCSGERFKEFVVWIWVGGKSSVIGQCLHFSVARLQHSDERKMQYNEFNELHALLTQSQHLIL